VSYIAFDLDALNVCPQVGAAAGLSAAEASHGLLQLWAWCFRSETDVVTETHLTGFFFGAKASGALEAFGFVERTEGGWRVRGAERYLRIKKAQREAGKRASGNLKRGRKKAGGTPPGVSRVDSGSTPGSAPALTPTTDDRRPNTESEKLSPPARSRVLSDRLVATFLEKRGTPYRFAANVDGPALARLLKLPVSDDEIDRRWRIGLDGKFQQETNSIAQLDSKWNALSKADGPPSLRDTPTTYAEGRVKL
jgi:hypothetical protein